MSKKKILIFGLLSSLLILTSLAFAQAAITFNRPASGATVNGTFNFNVTTSLDRQNTNFTVWVGTTAVCTSINITANQVGFNCTGSTTGLTDGSTTWNFTIYNATYSGAGQTTLESATQVNVLDNLAPVCRLTMVPANVFPAGDRVIADCSGSTDAQDTALTFSVSTQNPRDNSVANDTPSNGVATFTGGQIPHEGSYTFRCTATDNALQSTACSVTIRGEEDTTAPASGITSPPAQQILGNKNIIIIGGVATILIIAIVLGLTLSGGKKRRR